jgi:uncharacterized protein with FMN-binding domain
VRRAIIALLGTAAGTALLIGAKGGFPHDTLHNGTWQGDPKANQYGTVRLAIVVASGKITDVKVLDYPRKDPQAAKINSTALPKLRSSALAKQSADIDTVTGATVTSDGYRQSLQAAIDRARS